METEGIDIATESQPDLPETSVEAASAGEEPPDAAAEAASVEPEAAEAAPEALDAAQPEPTVQEIMEMVVSPTDALIDKLTASQQDAIETATASGAALFDGLGRVQRQIAAFVSDRVRQDMETHRAFLSCRSLEDVQEVQRRFIRSTMEQYAVETTRLMSLGHEIMTRSTGRD